MSRQRFRFFTWVLMAGLVPADGEGARKGNRYCSETAQRLYNACGSELQDDYWVATAICINLSDKTERAECYAEARASRAESRQLCREQLKWRREACKSLGEDRYDPDFDPASFETVSPICSTRTPISRSRSETTGSIAAVTRSTPWRC